MKRNKLFIITIVFIFFISGCSKYDDYVKDFDFTSVYFGSQKPLRTVVAREPMQIKFGVAFGGARENKTNQWVKFRLDKSLLNTVEGADTFKLMPESYYSMELPTGDSTFIIPAGKIIGDLVLTLNRDAFTADPLALGNTYAIPLRIYETSADSILSGNEVTASKDYTIIVIKYIGKESGTYYVKGSETDDATGLITTYSIGDLIKNKTRDLTTKSLTSYEMGGIGTKATSTLFKLNISLTSNGAVELSTATGGASVTDLGSSYDAPNKTFSLKYSYIDASKTYSVNEQLILRHDPELDLRFTEW